MSSASSAAITLQKELSTKRKVLREMECSCSELANELRDVKAQLEDTKDKVSGMEELRCESVRLKDRIKVLERQSKIKTSSFMNLSTTAGAASKQVRLGSRWFCENTAAASGFKIIDSKCCSTRYNQYFRKGSCKSKQEVKSLKEGDAGCMSDDEELHSIEKRGG